MCKDQHPVLIHSELFHELSLCLMTAVLFINNQPKGK
jgi:hypothetical protein